MRVVLYLSTEKKSLTMPQLADLLHIPYNNLSKLVQSLNKAGIIQTKQGKNGGIQLLKTPDTLNLKMIVDVIDGPTRLSDCLANHDSCTLSSHCKLKSKLRDIQTQIDTLLEEATLAEINKG